MTIIKKCKLHFEYFFKSINSLKKEIKFSLYCFFLFSFLAGVGVQFIPKLLAAREGKKLAEKTEEHSNKKSVSVAEVEVGEIKKTFTIFSSLKGKHEVQLFPDNKVSVKSVLASPGDFVKKGQVLAIFDSSSLQIRKRLSDIDFQLKEAEYKVTKSLAEREFVSKNEMNQKALEFEAEKLRQELSLSESTTTLIAPISGLVTDVKFNSGDYVDDVSKYYLKIVDQTSYRIEAYLPYEIAKQLKVGGMVEVFNIQNTNSQEIKVRAPASSENYSGKITRISPGIDQATGTVNVDIEANLPAKDFQVGSFVESRFILDEARNAIIVKNESILYDNDRPYVFKLKGTTKDDSSVQKSYVTLGLNEGSKTAILDGLEGTDFVVYEGQGNLKDKDIVEVFDR